MGHKQAMLKPQLYTKHADCCFWLAAGRNSAQVHVQSLAAVGVVAAADRI